jgi:hypothetical protein
MPTYAGQIDVEIVADDENEAEDVLRELRKTVARNPEVEMASAGGVECIYDCPEDAWDLDLEDLDDEEDPDDVPF